jgi:hypothetical protein
MDLRRCSLVEIGLHDVPEEIGYPIEPEYVQLDIYRLLCCFGGSPLIKQAAQSDNNWESSFFHDFSRYLERSEISRLLISIAATSRNNLDQMHSAITGLDGLPEDDVGELIPKWDENDVTERLAFREACNKILHAQKITFNANQDQDWKTCYLFPTVYLYGEKSGVQWRATLDIFRFCFWAGRHS